MGNPANRGINLAETNASRCGRHSSRGACYTIAWGPSRKCAGGAYSCCDTRTSNTGYGPYIRH